MNEYEEYLRQRQVERGKEYQKKKDWLIGQWKNDPERFPKQILFDTEPEELQSIMKVLKKTNPTGYQFILDYQLIWSFLLKSEKEISVYIKSKELFVHLDYFILICEKELRKDAMEYLEPQIAALGLNRIKDKSKIEELMNEFISRHGSGWKKVIAAFDSIKKDRLNLSGKPQNVLGDELQKAKPLDDELQRLFKAEKVKEFLQFERDFLGDFISQDGTWKEAEHLAALLFCLINLGFIRERTSKRKIMKYPNQYYRADLRRSFERRYGATLAHIFEAGKMDRIQDKINKIKERFDSFSNIQASRQ